VASPEVSRGPDLGRLPFDLFPKAFGKVKSFLPYKKIYLSVSMPETIPIDYPIRAAAVHVPGSGHYR